jgi:hypothetical protein
MDGVEDVALLALLYRAHYRARHTGPDSLLEDFESCPGEVSLATMTGSHTLREVDWFALRVMHDPKELNRIAAELDQQRAEALLHVWPVDAPPPDGVWTLPYGADRWDAVEAAMRRMQSAGFAASRDDVECIASSVYTAVTGKTYEDYLNEYADTIFAS